MGMIASLSGNRVTTARINIPAWGLWFASVSIDGEAKLSGAVEMKIADLTLKGTVLSGGASKGRAHYRIVAGAGGWGRTIPDESYASDAGVKLATVLGDAARLAGETLGVVSTSDRVGPSWTRPEGPAAHVLERLAPKAWYVGEDGVTRLGKRPTVQLAVQATRVEPVDRARGTVTIAAESIASIVPGIVVDGLEAVDVQHDISKEGLRSRIDGAAETSRRLAALKSLFEQLDPLRKFRGLVEYRVVTQEGERLNLQPVQVSTGMPDLKRVPVRPGVAGCRANVMLGERVVVGFVNSDPGRPEVFAHEDADGGGFTPLLLEIDASTVVKLADGLRPMPATGDLAGGIWPIVGTTRVLG